MLSSPASRSLLLSKQLPPLSPNAKRKQQLVLRGHQQHLASSVVSVAGGHNNTTPAAAAAAASAASKMNKENFHLKEILLSQLELIQQQSEKIVEKDKKLREMQRENEKLKQRLRQMELLSASSPPGSAKAEERAKFWTCPTATATTAASATPPAPKSSSDKAVVTDISDVVLPLPFVPSSESAKPSTSGQAKTTSCSSSCSDTTTTTARPAARPKPPKYLETTQPYFVWQGEEHIEHERRELSLILRQCEIPGWRPVSVAACYSMEGTENIEDDTLLKRHQKPEFDEKRRKRWDIQRLREQRQLEKLKARYDEVNGLNSTGVGGVGGAGGGPADSAGPAGKGKKKGRKSQGKNSPAPTSAAAPINAQANPDCTYTFLPDPYGITGIVVAEMLPVNAFGHCSMLVSTVTKCKEAEFSLPWLSSSSPSRASSSESATTLAKSVPVKRKSSVGCKRPIKDSAAKCGKRKR